jgi:hypothetical protein
MEGHAHEQPRSGSEPIEVAVNFAAAGGPVSGTVLAAGAATAFHGWLELMDALEAARLGAAPERSAPKR